MEGTARQTAIERLANFERLPLGFFPTPIEEMPRLRTALGTNCPRLFIKRDDYTGFGFGGNKVRILEFLLAQAVGEGVQAVITTGGDRSNHARQMAAFCARLGLRCILVLDRKPRPFGAETCKSANVFVSEMMGAEVHIAGSIDERKAWSREIADELTDKGIKVVEVPLGGALPQGTLGFITAMRELQTQCEKKSLKFNYIFVASSSACTQAGMLLGAKLFGFEKIKIVGVSPDDPSEDIMGEVKRMLKATGDLLGVEVTSLLGDVAVLNEYSGEGYCFESSQAQAALKLVARIEGILLDPVYTAKAMAGLIDWIRKGQIGPTENVLFWHTGGQYTSFYNAQPDSN